MGGTIERHIRTMKSILNNILHTHGYILDTSSLTTYLYEVMALINSRPLTETYIHDTQLDPLTPNHLITIKPDLHHHHLENFTPKIYLVERYGGESNT